MHDRHSMPLSKRTSTLPSFVFAMLFLNLESFLPLLNQRLVIHQNEVLTKGTMLLEVAAITIFH